MPFEARPGLYGRQANIDLTIPKWFNIYIADLTAFFAKSDNVTTEVRLARRRNRDFLFRLIEGMATAGANGVSIIADFNDSDWNLFSGAPIDDENFEKWVMIANSRIQESRPYFQSTLSNLATGCYPGISTDELISGETIYIIDGTIPEISSYNRMYAALRQSITQLIDLSTCLVAKTRMPIELAQTILSPDSQIAIPVAKLPHWSDNTSRNIAVETTAILSNNIMCKPNLLAENQLFFTTQYLDEMVVRGFNDAGLRARYNKEPKAEAPVPSNDNAPSAIEENTETN